MKYLYDCMTFVAVKVFITYAAFPFALIYLQPGFEFYKRLYFAGHIIAVLMIVVLPRLLRVHRGSVKPVDDEQLTASTGSSTPHDTPLHMAYSRQSKHSASVTSSDSMAGIRMMSIPPLVDKAIAELPTADPLVSPRHSTMGTQRNRKNS